MKLKKRKTGMQIKHFEGKSLIFKNGLHTLKGIRFKGKPMTMSLQELHELKQEIVL